MSRRSDSADDFSLAPKIATFILERIQAKEREEEGDKVNTSSVPAQRLPELPADEDSLERCRSWLDKAATDAKQLRVATHPAKFCHPDSRGNNLIDFRPVEDREAPRYVSTSSLRNPELDWAGNAAALGVAKLLSLVDRGETLLSRLQAGITSDLEPFSSSADQAHEWRRGLLAVCAAEAPRSHALGKQVYFPVMHSSNAVVYNLLCPITSSALAQAISNRVAHSRFSENAEAARNAERKHRWSEHAVVSFPELAQQKYGGTKPQNISLLNSKRKGVLLLLRSMPPHWEGKMIALKRPGDLWRYLFHRALRPIADLRDWIHHEQENNLETRARRAQLVSDILDLFLHHISSLRSYYTEAGVIFPAALSSVEQAALAPWRTDATVALATPPDDWRGEFAAQFARQLLKKLAIYRGRRVIFTDDHLHRMTRDARDALAWLDEGEE